MKNICLGWLAIVGLSSGMAQGRYSGGAGYFNIGFALPQALPIQDFLPASFPEPGAPAATFGGSGYVMVGRWVIGAEGSSSMENTSTRDTLTASRGWGNGYFSLGYAVVNKARFKVFPMLGVGSVTHKIRIRDNRPVDFTDIQQSPQPWEVNYQRTDFSLAFSVGMDYILSKTKVNPGGWMLGLRLGYYTGFGHNRWDISGNMLNNGPSMVPHGFMAQVVLGGGGFSPMKKKGE